MGRPVRANWKKLSVCLLSIRFVEGCGLERGDDLGPELVALCSSPWPDFLLMVWSMSVLHWADSLSCGNHLRRNRLERIYEMHSLWSVCRGKQSSICNGGSVIVYYAVSGLAVVFVHSLPRVQHTDCDGLSRPCDFEILF